MALVVPLGLIAVVITGLLVLIGVLLALLVSTSWGTSAVVTVAQHWLMPLHIEQAEGALLGEGRIKQVRWSISATQTLDLDQIDWRFSHITLEPWPALHFEHLHAQALTLRGAETPTPQTPAAPLTPPRHLVLPVGVHIESVALDTLSLPALEDAPLRQLKARLDLIAGPLGQHHIDRIEGTWSQLRWRGQGGIEPTAPLKLHASAHIETTETAPIAWQAEAQASGVLSAVQLHVDLHGLTQTLQGTAEVLPFAAWPLPRLSVRADQLNLAALHPGAPITRLHGDVVAEWQAPTAWSLRADVHNALADGLEHQGLPIRHVQAQMTAQRKSGVTSGQLNTLVVELGREQLKHASAHIEGHGQWALDERRSAQRLSMQLSSQITRLRPAEIDPRAPAFEITGPLDVEGLLPWPINATAGSTWPRGTPDLHLSVKADLRGQQLDHSRLPEVQLQFKGKATTQGIHIEQLNAQAGATRLQAQGQWEQHPGQRAGPAQHHVVLEAALQHFDPRVWWPGPAGAAALEAWRNHPTRLDGTVKADLTSSSPASPQGYALVQLSDSVLAGLPLAGTLRVETLKNPRNAPEVAAQPATLIPMEPPPLQIQAEMRLGPMQQSTELTLHGAWHTEPSEDQWHLKVHSPALHLLQPWLSLAGSPAEIAGDLEADVDLQGRWPEVYGSGHIQAQDVRVDLNRQDRLPGLHLQTFNTRFDVGSHPRDQLDVQLSLSEASWPGLHLGATELRLLGSVAKHRLRLQSLVQLSDPATGAVHRVLPTQLLARLAAEGRWQHRPNSDAWEGQVSELSVRDAQAPASEPDQLHLDPTTLHYHREAQTQSVVIDPTRLQLSVLHLVMDEFLLQTTLGASRPRMIWRTRLEPLDIAPLLARAQPGFGWAGDLKIGGHIDVAMSPEQFNTDIALERLAGDLQVHDPDNPAGPQPLGLADMRLALKGQQGHWQLREQVAGGYLGSLEGLQTLDTQPQALWPSKDDAIGGSIDLHIAELGRWGRWLPPGWRLSGKLDTQARLQGSLGTPDLSGELHGSKIGVQNALNGVDWHDAELHATLSGNTARIDTLQVRAGEGRIHATGQMVISAGNPHLSLTAIAEQFALLQRVDRHIVVSGTTRIDLDKYRTTIEGELRADEGRIDFSQGDAPGLSDDVTTGVTDQPNPKTEGEPSTSTANARTTVLDLKLDMGEAFALRGRGLNTRLIGAVALTNPGGKLAVNGTIRTSDEGTYAAYGQKLAIDRGLIIFSGSPNNPQLDIQATRPDIDEVRVGVAVTGTVENMRVRLFSEPVLNDTDKLSWLILGRAPDGLGRTDLALLQRAAYALISGEGDSPSLLERVGLDQVSVRKSDGEVSETVVSLGKQLSRRWYVGYERSLNAASGTWQLIYRIAQRFTLRAQSGTERAIDLIWIWRWRPPDPVIEPTPTPPAVTGNDRQGT
jgi:translocation and assembly module TamB